MDYSAEEVMQHIAKEDVKFIRLAFCDVRGRQKNISIMPGELRRAFSDGIAIDASSIEGFGGEERSDVLLHPDPGTIAPLPWRPEHGRVLRMFCTLKKPDGSPFPADTRALLARAVEDARKEGLSFFFGTEGEFYLFRLNEDGERTDVPYDCAGYMDMAPLDRGENVRREICLTLEQMGIRPERSHHEAGPGQNEIDFRYAEPLTAADDALTFRTVVDTVAARSGLAADFSPKPLADKPGNGMHINFSVKGQGEDVMPYVIAGVMAHICEITAFLNVSEASYRRFGVDRAPKAVSWSPENRSQLIRIPAAAGEYRRAELRSPDPLCNPYLAFSLLIYAGLWGVRNRAPLMPPKEADLFHAPPQAFEGLELLPESLAKAKRIAACSPFVQECLPKELIDYYTR